jgi:hypothetical protein
LQSVYDLAAKRRFSLRFNCNRQPVRHAALKAERFGARSASRFCRAPRESAY